MKILLSSDKMQADCDEGMIFKIHSQHLLSVSKFDPGNFQSSRALTLFVRTEQHAYRGSVLFP